jgi:hypothetical protein
MYQVRILKKKDQKLSPNFKVVMNLKASGSESLVNFSMQIHGLHKLNI